MSGCNGVWSACSTKRKKQVYLAHDTTLDREVAFALIKTEGLDDTSRTRIQREAQTMGNLEQAMVHYEEELAFCRKGGFRTESAWTCCDYADALRQRDGEGDRASAVSLLDESLATSIELDMRPFLERVLSRWEILGA